MGAFVPVLRGRFCKTTKGYAVTQDTNALNFDRVVELFNHENVNGFGPMHIVVEDGNVFNTHLDSVEVYMKKEGASAEEWELLNLLRQLDENTRFEAWEKSIGR